MKFLIIGIICLVFGIFAKTNPEGIRRFLNSKAEPAEGDINRTRTAGTIVLVCGVLLVILGIITLIAG